MPCLRGRTAARQTGGVKPVRPDVIAEAASSGEKAPTGVYGTYPIAFGGGQQGIGADCFHA